VAAAFLQPIEFRHPAANGAANKGDPGTVRPRGRADTVRARQDTTPAGPDSGAAPH
jgi:hypothetical protein